MKFGAQQSLVRAARESDCVQLASLTEELGYPASAEEIADRLQQICGHEREQAIFVVEVDQKVAGFIQVGLRTTLATQRSAEIYELVISESYRSHGLGGLLVMEAETWGRAVGCERMLVRSRLDRTQAHRFYQTRGYSIEKTQAVFGKKLS